MDLKLWMVNTMLVYWVILAFLGALESQIQSVRSWAIGLGGYDIHAARLTDYGYGVGLSMVSSILRGLIISNTTFTLSSL